MDVRHSYIILDYNIWFRLCQVARFHVRTPWAPRLMLHSPLTVQLWQPLSLPELTAKLGLYPHATSSGVQNVNLFYLSFSPRLAFYIRSQFYGCTRLWVFLHAWNLPCRVRQFVCYWWSKWIVLWLSHGGLYLVMHFLHWQTVTSVRRVDPHLAFSIHASPLRDTLAVIV